VQYLTTTAYPSPPYAANFVQVNITDRPAYPPPELLVNPYDAASIMLYPYPAEWTTDGSFQDWNRELSDGDHSAVAMIYPLGGHVISSQRTMQADDAPIRDDYIRFDFPANGQRPRVVSCLSYVQTSNADTNFRVAAGVCALEVDQFAVAVTGGNNSTLINYGVSTMRIPGADALFRTGTITVTTVGQEIFVPFDTPFQAGVVPRVFVGISNIQMTGQWGLATTIQQPVDVTNTGFIMYLGAHSGTVLESVTFQYVAVSPRRSGVQIETFDAAGGVFTGTFNLDPALLIDRIPSILVGVTGFDIVAGNSLNFQVSATADLAQVTWTVNGSTNVIQLEGFILALRPYDNDLF